MIYIFYIINIILVFILFYLSIWLSISKYKRIILCSCFVLVLFINIISLIELLGNPKDIKYDIHNNINNSKLLYYYFIDGEGIYLLLKIKDNNIPIYYKMEWDMELAKKIKRKSEEGREGDKDIELKYDYSMEDRKILNPVIAPERVFPPKE